MRRSSQMMEVWDAPWKVKNQLDRMLCLPAARAHFALAGIAWGKRWQIFGLPILQRYRGSRIELGDYLCLRSTPQSNPLTPYGPVVLSTRSRDAAIRIGNHCGLTGAVVVAQESITIGDHVLLGANSIVMDTDFHPLLAHKRRLAPAEGRRAPVVIDDDVFVGTQAIILPGVHLGRECVVGAGSIVTKSVPPNAIVAGNPAKIVGYTTAHPA